MDGNQSIYGTFVVSDQTIENFACLLTRETRRTYSRNYARLLEEEYPNLFGLKLVLERQMCIGISQNPNRVGVA